MRKTSSTSLAAALGLIFLCGSVASAQQPPRPERDMLPAYPVLTATGRGEVSVAPDRAVVRVGAVAQEKDAAAAQARVNDIVQRVIEEVQTLGVKKEAVKTSRVSLQPVYSNEMPPRPFDPNQPNPPQPRAPEVVGYRASNVIEIRLDDLNQVGAVIDAGMKSGANTIEGVDFQLANDTRSTQDALRKAAEAARAKAEAMAGALGLKLAGVVEVTEGNVQRIMPMMGRAVMAMSAKQGGAPIEPGEVKVEGEVTVTYRLADK
jgi:uncharacterized protein YggE